MNIISVLSSLIIIIGCLLPWIQFGTKCINRGIDNPDGAILLIASIVSIVIAIYNQTKNQMRYKLIYLVVGIIGIYLVYIDLNVVNKRIFNSIQSVGPGLYIIGIGSIGLIISGLGIFKKNKEVEDVIEPFEIIDKNLISSTKKCPECAEIIKIEAKICRFCQYKFTDEEMQIQTQTVEDIEDKIKKDEEYKKELSLLFNLIKTQKNKILGGGMTDEILFLIGSLCKTQDDAINLLTIYKSTYKSDLIIDLKKLNSTYSDIKRNLSIFIDFNIVDENYPHEKIIIIILKYGSTSFSRKTQMWKNADIDCCL